ncbi:MAG: UDP-N-acetylglucosamine pyrophosphorylase [Ruminococcaceae bacterium]|nr:UDP-N-acetylglucosamine pyrophosphorylase [Oscillospiraceae bacterium]
MDINTLKAENLFDLGGSVLGEKLREYTFPWEILPQLKKILPALGEAMKEQGYQEIAPQVWVAEDVTIAPSASIQGPCIIGAGTEIRHCAYIRGNVLIGSKCVVGNSSELKNCVLFDLVQVPHYNYVGDAILGKGAHLGAGSIISNLKSDKKNIVLSMNGETLETGLRKFGAMVGDWVEVGCGSVLNPGTIIGRESRVYPLSCVRGIVPEKHIFKQADKIVPIL